ncbi:methionyl-tRNA formyltransferase [Pedobacter sp. L105]|uniref:methionyl-tRNA formyltransferase n=1 Tax=Pedobacter sp. L105 TaxID=1641871 RepID=UPI00131BD2B1|nr:formyltransferase family protein [Pedobacter sp. L105]
MKIVLFANHLAILPVINYFYSRGWLSAVVSTDKLHGENLQIEDFCNQQAIPFCKVIREELKTTVLSLLHQIEPDLVFMCGFSYRIPGEVFSIPFLGFYNIHFSLLPAYRGPDPIFWQLKNGEQTGGISIHKVNAGFDAGEVVAQQEIPFIPGENWGICNSRYIPIAFNMIKQLAEKLMVGDRIPLVPTDHVAGSYYPKPGVEDLALEWDIQTSEQIEQLVNACNPGANGAITVFKQQMVRILEVSPVDGTGDPSVSGGSIVHADSSGLYVQCADQKLLRINILRLKEGFMTGFKLAALGVSRGDCFENVVVKNLSTI